MTERAELEKLCQEIGGRIARAANVANEKGPAKIGFALLIFDLGEGGNLAWISNAERDDMIEALKEFIKKSGVSFDHAHRN